MNISVYAMFCLLAPMYVGVSVYLLGEERAGYFALFVPGDGVT